MASRVDFLYPIRYPTPQVVKPLLEVLYFDNFIILDNKFKRELGNHVVKYKDVWDSENPSKKDSNFLIKTDYHGFFDSLYDRFFDACNRLFGPLTLTHKNSRRAWGVATNEDYWVDCPHRHLHTCTISGVFYITKPPEVPGGDIFFRRNESEKWIKHTPKEEQLVIFPNYMYHTVDKFMSKQWRTCVNIELRVNETIDWQAYVGS